MIFIERSTCPASLFGRSADGDHYNKPAVVHALWDMQYGKCCYCERRLPDKGHLKAVDHFAPKAIFRGRRNEWPNLLLSCSQCNGKKSDKFPMILSLEENEDKVLYVEHEHSGVAAIIDPGHEDPEEHLEFDFTGEEWRDKWGAVRAKGGSVLGTETIATIGLDGPFYSRLTYDHYTKILRAYYTNLLQALKDGNELTIKGQKDSFELLMAPQSELAGFARAYARMKRLEEDPINLTIPAGKKN